MNKLIFSIEALFLLSAPLYGALPDDTEIEFSIEFAGVFNKMVKEGLRGAGNKSCESKIYTVYKIISRDGIIELGKKRKSVAKATQYEMNILDKDSINKQRENILQLIAQKASLEKRTSAWRLLQKESYNLLKTILEADISGLQLSQDVTRTIDDNQEIDFSVEQRPAFWGAQLAIASGMEALYRRDRESFDEMFKQWLSKDTSGWCIVS